MAAEWRRPTRLPSPQGANGEGGRTLCEHRLGQSPEHLDREEDQRIARLSESS
jgi:hypothetical protein